MSTAKVTCAEARDAFYETASWAMERALLNRMERDIICRRGHRKEWYWVRHLRDLHDIVALRAFGPPTVPRGW